MHFEFGQDRVRQGGRRMTQNRNVTKSAASFAPSNIPDAISVAVGRCLEQCPTLVLGSGASIPLGIPGMPTLQAHLLKSVAPDEQEIAAWLFVKTALANGDDLETALLHTQVPDSLSRKIVESTWGLISGHDADVLEKLATGSVELPLSRLLRWLTRSTHHEISIVTTNYDRLAEYAADAADLVHLNGFGPGYVRNRETSTTFRVMRGSQSARMARLWKVHGSLDWFERANDQIICARLTRARPIDLRPVIVTPGVEKYLRTHLEPFRTIMAGADNALGTAKAVLCIGYGFRDTHIEPKLVDRCRNHGIPLVILAKTLTPQARTFLKDNAGANYVAFEEAGNDTLAITSIAPEGITMPNVRLWDLTTFLNQFIS